MAKTRPDTLAHCAAQPSVIQVQPAFAHDTLGKLIGGKWAYGSPESFQKDTGDFTTESMVHRRDRPWGDGRNVYVRREYPDAFFDMVQIDSKPSYLTLQMFNLTGDFRAFGD